MLSVFFKIIFIISTLFMREASKEFNSQNYKNKYRIEAYYPKGDVPDIKEITYALNGFDSLFYREHYSSQENFSYSPVSLFYLLYSLQAGADGKTEDELSVITGIPYDLSYDEQLNEIIDNTTPITNSIWYQKSLEFSEFYTNFLDRLKFIPKKVNFQNKSTYKKINSFVNKQTKGTIKNLLKEPLPPESKIVLLNTLYFNQKWVESFNRKDTYTDKFFISENKSVDVQMMSAIGYFDYYISDEMTLLSLKYESNRFRFIIGFPNNGNYDANKIDPNLISLIMKNNSSTDKIKIIIPKFKVENSLDIVEILKKMGVYSPFDPARADYSRVLEDEKNICFDTVIQNSSFTIDEEKTVASAATVSTAKSSGISNPDSYDSVIKIDRPFLYAIYDEDMDINLFSGIIRNPQ